MADQPYSMCALLRGACEPIQLETHRVITAVPANGGARRPVDLYTETARALIAFRMRGRDS